MRIRSQIAIAIVPLFLGLTIVTGALTYYLQVKELTWGLNEEVTSIAVSAARLIDAPTAGRLAAGEKVSDAAIREQFLKVIAWRRARRLTLLAARDRRVLVDVRAGGGGGEVPAAAVEVPAAAVAALERQPFVNGPLHRGTTGPSTLTAFAPVRDGAGALLCILAVETYADTLTSERVAILRSVVISLCAATLIGLLLVVFISAMITRRISELTNRVRQVEAGSDTPDSGTGIIDEVNDLVNTFDTMKSVLGEVLTKAKRTQIESEQFRNDEDLMHAYRSEFLHPVRKTVAGIDAAGALFGSRPSGSFFGIWDLPAGGCAFVGTVAEQGVVEQTVAAAAALAYLEQAARNGAVGPALASTAELFPLTLCDGVVWREGGKDGVRWSLDRAAGAWRQKGVDLLAGQTVVFHTLGASADSRIHTYVEQFQGLPADVLLGEVRLIIDENLSGSLLLVRRAATDTAPA